MYIRQKYDYEWSHGLSLIIVDMGIFEEDM
jgi:hypothetical protein